MIDSYVKSITRHPALARTAGALVGWKAASGSLFAQLIMLASIGSWLDQRKARRAAQPAAPKFSYAWTGPVAFVLAVIAFALITWFRFSS